MKGEDVTISSLFVLIETYWNVNSTNIKRMIGCGKVLIETYWNVNGIECTGITLVVKY